MNSRDEQIKQDMQKIEGAYRQGRDFNLSRVFEELCNDLGFKKNPVHYQRPKNPDPIMHYDPENRFITMDFGKFDTPRESLTFKYLGGEVEVTQKATDPDFNFIKYQTPQVDNELVKIISEEAKKPSLSQGKPDGTVIMTKIYHIELADSLRAIIQHSDLVSKLRATYSDSRPQE